MSTLIPRSKLTIVAMVAGNEKEITHVIVNGTLKQWVGIGWVDLREATREDYTQYPEMEE